MKALLKFAIPGNTYEKTICFICFILYAILSTYIALTTYAIDHEEILFNLYFGFDTQNFVKKFFSFFSTTHLTDAAHPFFRIIMLPVIFISNVIFYLLGYKAKTVFLVLITSLLVSGSLMLIFRYLYSFLRIGCFRSALITGIATFFSTNLILSFTPESYPVSLYLLTFVFTYYSFAIKEKGHIPFSQFFTLTLLTAGTTVTNGVKCCIPELISGLPFREKCRRLFKMAGYMLLLCLVYYSGIITLMYFLKGGEQGIYLPWQDAIDQLFLYNDGEQYNKLLHASYGKMIFSYLLGNPLLFGDFFYQTIFNKAGIAELNIRIYDQVWQYIFIAILFIVVLYVTGKNLKNKYFIILVLSFGVDLFIHIGLNFGIYEAFIYGAHWVYLIPMIWGWVYYNQPGKKQQLAWDIFFILAGTILIINNIYRMIQFICFFQQNYPV
ncbi:MAG: DUF6080 domain-containing protein [Tannerellaceae bacterium]|nr:DUF6080 domain-containing protein [Tannerellaceae bacterium]